MKQYLSLVKLLIKSQFRAKPTADKKKRIGGKIAVIVILALGFLPMLCSVAGGTYFLGKYAGPNSDLVSFIILICQGLVLMFGMSSILAIVYNGNDADKLLYLPVKPTTVFLAKMTVVYITEVVTTAVLILFSLVPYGIGAGATVNYYLVLVLALFIIPVLPLLVGAFLGMPLSVILTKIKNNGIAKTIIQVVFFVAVMALYIWAITSVTSSTESMGADENTDLETTVRLILDNLRISAAKAAYVHPNLMLATAMTVSTYGTFVLTFLVMLAENALLLWLLILVSLPFYRWILTASLETTVSRRKKVNSGQLQVKNKGALRELIVTDLKRTLRNSQMGFQAFIGLLAMPLLMVVMSFAFNQDTENGVSLIQLMANDPLYQAIAPVVIVGYMSMLGIGSNVLGLYPISRENNSLYVIKCLPVSFNKILLSKVILSTGVMLCVDFLTCVFAVIFFKVHWYFGIIMVVVMALLGFGGMCITTLLDLKSPHLGWTNFNASLKNAKNSWLAMLIGLVLMIVLAVIAVGFIIWFVNSLRWFTVVFMWIAFIGFAAGFAVVSYRIMTQKAEKYFANIEP